MELVSVTKVIRYLEEGYNSPTCLKNISKELLTKVSKELCQYVTKTERGFKLLEDFLNALQVLVKHNSNSFQFLSDNGLTDVIGDVYQNVLQRLTRDGTTEGLQVIVEMLLEVTNVLADLHTSAKSEICQGLCPYMLDLLQADKLEFQVKMEVVKSTNMLLDQCPTGTKEAILLQEDFQKKIADIVNLIKGIGDYEFQVGLVECLIRLFPRKSRQRYASQFIKDTMMLEGFLNIKDREFETDCRRFLNDLNSRMDKKGVFSIPCVAAFVGNKQLRKPSDTGYDQFWVDFNIGSQRMTLFCEQDSLLSQGTSMDEQLWETVAIYKTDILKCSCCEIQGAIILEIGLKQRVCELYPSQHQDVTDNTVRVEFELERELEIAQAVGKTFCFTEIRNKVSTVVDPIQISIREVQEQDSQSQLQESEDPEMPYQTNMVPPASQESTARRRKVSVPSVPMRTPTSTPVIPADKASVVSDLCERTSAKLTDRAQKVSSATAPLKISTKDKTSVESKQAHHVTEMAGKMLSASDEQSAKEDGKKKHQTQEAKKQLSTKGKNKNTDFAVPKTPVAVSRTSKPKVKTPVVTITPPAANKRKNKKSSKEPKDVEEIEVSEKKVKEPEIVDPESIPDSIPTDVVEGNDFSVSKEAIGSKNTTVDSGINLDESRVSDSYTTSELKEAITVPLNDVKNNQASPVKGFSDKEETRSKKNKKSKAENEMSKMTEHRKKNHTENSVHSNTTVQRDTDSRPVTDDQNLTAEPYQQLVSAVEDDEDKFDFDSQQDKIPDSLEPSVKPNLKPTNEKAVKIHSKENNITEKYLKMLESKGVKKKESKLPLDHDVVNEVNSKSSKHADSIKKQSKSFTDLEPSLKDLYMSEHKNSSKQKQDRKSKLKSKGKEAHKATITDNPSKEDSNRSNISSAITSGKESKIANSSNTRRLRSRSKNKSYKEADESDSFSAEDPPGDKDTPEVFICKPNAIAKFPKNKKEEHFQQSEQNKSLKELSKGSIKPAETLVSKTHTADEKCEAHDVYDKCGLAEDENFENITHPCQYLNSSHVEDTIDARSNESSDISEDYRFNNSQASLDVDKIPDTHEHKDCLNNCLNNTSKLKRPEENAKFETDEACNLSADLQANIPVRNRKGEKDTVDKPHRKKDKKQKSADKMEENSANKNLKKPKKHKKIQPATDYSEKSSSDTERLESNNCKKKIDEKKEKVMGKTNKEGKDSRNKSVTIQQKRESMEYADGDGHLKQCKVNSMSKKKGKGFVFQMSYCRSETNYKYKNKFMSSAGQSNLSNGYDPYDFTACENESVKEEVVSPCTENRKGLNYNNKPRKFFKHARSNENNEFNSGHDETRTASTKNQSRTNTKCNSTIEAPELNDSLVLSLTSPNEKTSKHKQKHERKYNKTVPKKQTVEINCNTIDTDSTDSLIITSDSPQDYNKNVKAKSKHQNTTRSKRKSKPQNKTCSHEKTNNMADLSMESDSTSVSPELSKDQTHRGKKSIEKHKNKSHQNSGYDQIDNTIDLESDGASEISVNKYSGSKTGRDVKRRERKSKKAPEKALDGATIDLASDDNLVISPDQLKTSRLLEQDPVTKKWYRKSDLLNHKKNKAVAKAEDHSSISHPVHEKKSRYNEKEKVKQESVDIEEIQAEIVEEIPVESDEMASQEENSFSKIVKDIVAARAENKTKRKKKHSEGRHPPKKVSDDKEIENKNEDSCFKEFDSEIVDCIMEDVLKTPCVSASLASTPKVGSARRKHYNPLNISIIKTPVSLTKSVTFDDDVGAHDSEDEDKLAEKTNSNKHRRRGRREPVQYKDLSDEEIDRDERLSQSSSRRSISSLLDSSNNISSRSEKSWILERKKTPKPKPKTYKGHKQQKLYNSQTESSEEDEPCDRSVASRSLSGRSGILSLDIPTPSLSSVCRASKRQEDEDNLILTPITPQKLSNSQSKTEDDIEVYQTQENCTLSLDMNKKHAETEDMDVSEIGSLCLSALGVKTPQKHPQEEDDKADLEESAHKKLQESLKLILGDSGFASGPSSEVRPSRSTLKRKFPDVVECESGSNPLSDEESTAEIEKPSILVPKKLFKFDHSSILETVNARSDTASTCSDTMEEQQDLEYPFQSGLSSFMTAFGADIQKHLNHWQHKLLSSSGLALLYDSAQTVKAKKQRFEELTKGVLKSTQKKFSSTWLEQQQYQSSVTEDFQAKMMAELVQLEADIVKMKEVEMKSEEYFKSQLEILHSSYISQTTRLANLKKMHSSYRDRTRKVQKYNSAAHGNMMDQLKKEMAALQKKLIQETQKQELMNVRRGLQNLF